MLSYEALSSPRLQATFFRLWAEAARPPDQGLCLHGWRQTEVKYGYVLCCQRQHQCPRHGVPVKAGLSSLASGVRRPDKSKAFTDLRHTYQGSKFLLAIILECKRDKHTGFLLPLTTVCQARRLSVEQPPRQNIKACSYAFLTEPTP